MTKPQHSCPACNKPLLRHINQGDLVWFCTVCREQFPFPFVQVKPKPVG